MDRRNFIKGVAVTGPFFLALRTAVAAETLKATSLGQINPSFFSPIEKSILARICDFYFPESSKMGSVEYIENLLTAFDANPPRIFAGGPYSGRNQVGDQAVQNSFAAFVPLNRYQELAWRVYLYGSDVIPGGLPNDKIIGKKRGLRNILKTGLNNVYRQLPESGLVTKPASLTSILMMEEAEFTSAIRDLTIESCFAAPEYGGNKELKGWKIAHFHGDSAPYGFSHYDPKTQAYTEDPNRPVSKADPTNPDPLTLSTRFLFRLVALFQGGRKYY